MIKCPKCYRDIENNEANFCPYCSQPLRGGLENIKKTFNILKILRNIRYSLTKKPVKNKLRVVKINLIIFAIFPIMLIGAIGIRYGAIIVLFQYLLSKKNIMNDKINKVNTVIKISLRTWLISIFVFILSIILSIMLLKGYGNVHTRYTTVHQNLKQMRNFQTTFDVYDPKTRSTIKGYGADSPSNIRARRAWLEAVQPVSMFALQSRKEPNTVVGNFFKAMGAEATETIATIGNNIVLYIIKIKTKNEKSDLFNNYLENVDKLTDEENKKAIQLIGETLDMEDEYLEDIVNELYEQNQSMYKTISKFYGVNEETTSTYNLFGLVLEIGNLWAILYIIISFIKTILGLFIRRKNEKE